MYRNPAVICWFSCGSASATAAKYVLGHPVDGMDTIIAYCDTSKNEHPDNERFLADCEAWFDQSILRLSSKRFPTMLVDDVFAKERYLAGKHGAPCTRALKKRVRLAFQTPGDIHVFGYTADEMDRWHSHESRNTEIDSWAPLIEADIDKLAARRAVLHAGIAEPAMYLLGYGHNNCLGCVKGGRWYWNKIRRDFPDVFARRAKQQREYDVAFWLRPGRTHDDLGMMAAASLPGIEIEDPRLFLDELPPTAGRQEDEPDIECGVGCDLWGRIKADAKTSRQLPMFTSS